MADINLDAGLPLFIEQNWEKGLPVLPKFLINALLHWPLKSHHDQLGEFFESDRMRALFSFQDLYIGLSPYTAPGVFSLLQSIELTNGIYYPIGGFAKIAEKMKTLCEDMGVKIHYDTSVSQIQVDPSTRRVQGVRCNHHPSEGEEEEEQKKKKKKKNAEEEAEKNSMSQKKSHDNQLFSADVIVSNADLPYTEMELLRETPETMRDGFEQREKKFKYSSSVVSICWAVKKRYDTALAHHSIFLSDKYRSSWDNVFEPTDRPDLVFPDDYKDFNFYVHAPSRTDPSCCPSDHDSIMVLVPAPPLAEEGGSLEDIREAEERLKAKAREAVIKRFEDAGMTDFRSSIVDESIRGPLEWKQLFNLRRGSVFGIAHPMDQLSLFRPSPEHPKLKNLFSVGASTRPGNGVPLVLVGAEQVARSILAREDELGAKPAT